jgi:hypothetical protein
MERVLQRMDGRRRRTPGNMIELGHIFVVHQATTDVPDTYSIINTKTRALGRCKNMSPIRAPLAVCAIGGLNSADFGVIFFKIVDVHVASQISKARNKNEATVWGEKDSVARPEVKVVLGNGASIKDGGFGRHVPVDDAELLRIRRPGHIVDRAFLVC